ncbi:MAG TPA: tRNA threonylcarbamoyladenosine dehydratase [Clostridia bacterium]|nr:tRNA threonylcarbamoyladenosine dehydratase [Clostridia bacterium]
MDDIFQRTRLLLGSQALARLAQARVAVFGLGGVGGHAAEALARSGIGSFVLIDRDRVCASNLNRQVIALHSTMGRYKTEVMKERILDINPKADVSVHTIFYLPGEDSGFMKGCDYIVDAIDTVSGKLSIVIEAKALGIPVISAMGCGNKVNPTRLEVADIYSTSVCPLCRVMRTELKKIGVESLKVVYSREKPIKHRETYEESCICSDAASRRKKAPGSVSFVPSVAGLIIASEVVKDLCGELWPGEEI